MRVFATVEDVKEHAQSQIDQAKERIRRLDAADAESSVGSQLRRNKRSYDRGLIWAFADIIEAINEINPALYEALDDGSLKDKVILRVAEAK